jgi:hypothetical protein
MTTELDNSPRHIIELELRTLPAGAGRDALPARCRVFLLDDSARVRAAAKRKPSSYRLPESDDLTAA